MSVKTYKNYIKDGETPKTTILKCRIKLFDGTNKCSFCVAAYQNNQKVAFCVLNLINILVTFWKNKVCSLLNSMHTSVNFDTLYPYYFPCFADFGLHHLLRSPNSMAMGLGN